MTGSNAKYSGVWNNEDSQILSDYADYGPFDAQEVQNIVRDMAIKRYMDQGAQNLRLFYRKYNILWASDDDIVNYLRAGLEQGSEETGSFDGLSRYLKLTCNLYYLLMMCLCLFFAVHFYRHDFNMPIIVLLLLFWVQPLRIYCWRWREDTIIPSSACFHYYQVQGRG